MVDKIRQRVVFQCHDLLSLKEIGHDSRWSYAKTCFSTFVRRKEWKCMRMFHRALAPGGFLVTEQTQEMPPELGPLFERVIPDGQLFRKVEAAACAS